MKKFLLSISIVLFILSSFAPATNAYGWGYKKNDNHMRPEVGKYKEILNSYFSFYVDESTEKSIYLTFDNGYEQGYTKQILDILKKHEVPATFFVTGHYVEEEPDLVKEMVAAGHIIGNHSYNHPDFTLLTKGEMKRELDSLAAAVADITEQKEMIYLRPPRGTFNEATLEWANELGYIHVFWSLAFKDWEVGKQKGAQYAYDQITAQVHPGAVMLLHTVSEDNALALEKVIIELKRQGYEFKSLDELVIKNILPADFIY